MPEIKNGIGPDHIVEEILLLRTVLDCHIVSTIDCGGGGSSARITNIEGEVANDGIDFVGG